MEFVDITLQVMPLNLMYLLVVLSNHLTADVVIHHMKVTS